MKIGAICSLRQDNADKIFDQVAQVGLKHTQITCWNPDNYTDDNATRILEQSKCKDVNICALWTGYTGEIVWNFERGPITLGLVPEQFRAMRVAELKRGADFAKKLKVPAIITHCGFLPENMTDSNYMPVVEAIADVASYCRELGLGFWFETGQETPVVLLRVIEEIGLDNLGINLDPANLIMYGKGSPCDALEVFGKYVRNIHVKDGVPPSNGKKLGPEVQVGTGFVNFPLFVKKLRKLEFDGDFIIEREISDVEKQSSDILETVGNLQKWWNEG